MRLLVTRHDLQARDTKALGPIRTREIEEVQFAGADSSRRGNSNGREIDPVMHRNGARRRLRAPEDVRGKAGPACRPACGGCSSAGVSARVRRCRACEAPGEPGPHHHHDFVGRGRGRLCRGGGLAPRWAPGQGPRVPAQGAAIRSQPAGGAGDAQPQHARRRGDAEGRRGGAGEHVAARGGADGNRSDRCRQARRLREGPRVGTEAAFARAARLARSAAALPTPDAKPLAALANVEFYRSHFAKGRESVAKARSLSTDESERLGLAEFTIFTHVAEGKYDAALQAASVLESEARAAKNPNMVVIAAMDRAFAAALVGKHAEGQKYASEAWARSQSEALSGIGRKDLQRGS